ncbi:hypothetical protein [Paenibacillus alvei]|nr:hypothetical protein [Paenibacillus alvei]
MSLPIRYAMTNAVKEIVQHKNSVEEVLNSMQKGLEEKLDAEREKENKKIFIVMDEIKKLSNAWCNLITLFLYGSREGRCNKQYQFSFANWHYGVGRSHFISDFILKTYSLNVKLSITCSMLA